MTCAIWFLRTAFLVAGCGSDPGPGGDPDAGGDSDTDSDADVAPILPACEETEPAGVENLEPVASTLVGTVESAVPRTDDPDDRTSPSSEDGEREYAALGMGEYSRGAGLERVRRTDLGDGAPTARRSIAYFVHMADFQLADDESPNRLAVLDNTLITSGLRPQEAYLPRAVSAMNRTLARIEPAGHPYDFGIVTGDCADSSQHNELQWVMQIMDGAAGVNTDSGEDDDPTPGPDNDPKDPFDAAAFPGPWYYVPGNHDVLVLGNAVPGEDQRASAIGSETSGGTRDYRIRWAEPVTGEIPPDPDRRIVDRDEIVEELTLGPSTPGPAGHGYEAGVDTSLGANYAADVVPGLLRVLTLDTNDRTGGAEGIVLQETVDGFLVPELERAADDGVLVMLASHHATSSMDTAEGLIGDPIPEALEPADVEALVATYPQVVAWLVGHSHDNRVRAIAGADADHPGYWEIMTSAMADWPLQSRVVEVVDNGDGTLSIFATTVDFDEGSCLERRFRRLALMDWACGWVDDWSSAPEDNNVELLRAVPATATAAVAAADGSDRIESDTTLRGK